MFSHNYGKHSRLNHKVYGCIKKTGCHTPRCYPIHSSKSCSQWVHCMLTVFFRLSQALWTDRAWTSRVFRRRYASNKMLAGSSNSILNPLPSYFANVGMGGYFNPFFNGQSSANHALLRLSKSVWRYPFCHDFENCNIWNSYKHFCLRRSRADKSLQFSFWPLAHFGLFVSFIAISFVFTVYGI